MSICRRAKALISGVLTIALVMSLIPAPALAEVLDELELAPDEPVELVGDVQEIGVGAVGGQVESIDDAIASVAYDEEVIYYDSLEEALDEAPDESTITLLDDATLEDTVSISYRNLTLDLDSHTLEVAKSEGLTAGFAATLTITNGFVEDGGTILVNNILYADEGTINLDGVTAACDHATIVRADNGGKVDIANSALTLWARTRSTAVSSGAGSELVVGDGAIIRSEHGCAAKATDEGTIIVHYGSTLQCENTTSSSKSAVEVRGGGKLLMDGGEIVCGGGTLENAGAGRALELNNGTADISSGTLIGGSAIYASGLSAEATVTGGFLAGEISTRLFASVEVSGGWFTDRVPDKCVYPDTYATNSLYDEAPDANYPYTVLPCTSISGAQVTVSRDFVYNGEAQSPDPNDITVSLNGEELFPYTDYTLEIAENRVDAGNHYIDVYGTGAYTGYAYGYFTIAPIDITEAEFEPIPDRPFDGGVEMIGELTMVDPEFTLEEYEDFTVDYEGNDGVGTATATVWGMGNFTGTQTMTFEITEPDKSGLEALVTQLATKVDDYTVSEQDGFDLAPGTQFVSKKAQQALQDALDNAQEVLDDENATKTGIADAIKDLERAYTTFSHSVKKAKQAVAINTRTTKLYATLAEALRAAEDNDTIELTTNTQVDSAIVVNDKTLTIDLAEHNLTIATSEGLKASDVATLTIKNGLISQSGNKTDKLIVAGNDGTVILQEVEAHTNSTTILVAEKGGSASIVDCTLSCADDNAPVIATGTYSRIVVEGEDTTILGNDIAVRVIRGAQLAVNGGQIDAMQALYVGGSGSYASVSDGLLNGELTVSGKGAIEVSGGWFSEKVPDNCVVVGMYATDALEDDAPDADFPYTVRTCTDISDATVDVATSFVYNGEQQAPSPTDITVTLAGIPLDPETDYELAIEEPSVNANTYEVSVEGTGVYAGTAQGTFVIAPVDITNAEFEAIADKPYNGDATTLGDITMVDPAFTLVEGVDFSADYENNDKLGQASASVQGIGNFKGSTTLTFEIVKPDKSELETLIGMVQLVGIVETTSEIYGYDLPVGTRYTTSEAKQDMEGALAAATEVLENDEATADQVDEALEALTDAFESYVKAIDEAILGVAENARLEMRYATLGDAVAEAEAGDTIKLLDDTTILRQVAIDKSLTLDLNGQNITSASVLPALSIAGEGVEVTIDDLAEGEEAGRVRSVADAAAEVADGAKLTIKGGRFVGLGSVVDVAGGTLAVEGGTFSPLVDLSGLLSNKLISVDTESYQDGDIVVTGGTFKNFDPSDNNGAGEHSDFTPLGFAGIEVEGAQDWWTVVELEAVEIPAGKTLTYSGEEQVGVDYDEAENDRYMLEANIAMPVGDYEATATLDDAHKYIWKNADGELIEDSAVQIAWKIEKAPATDVTIEVTSPLFAESEPLSIETAIKSVKIGDNELPETDYEIELVDADKPGTAKAILTGKDNVEGTTEVTFEIKPAPDKGDLRRANNEAAKLLDELDSAKTYNKASEIPNPIDGLYVGADALRELNNATKQADEVMADPQASPEDVKAADKRIEDAIADVKDSIRDFDHWERLWGQNGYDTMAAIVKKGFTAQNTSTVVIASRANWQDPLAATALAGTYNAPLLLVGKASESLPRQTRDEISRLKPSRVIVIGGTDVVSANTFNAIKSAAGGKATVTRVTGGNYIARANNMLNSTSQWRGSTAIVATQNSFRDSLSVAPVAYAQRFPIVYVGKKISNAEGGKLDSSTVSLLKSKKIKHIIIVGGELAVSKQVETQLKGMTIERWFGQNSLDTSAQIAQNAMDLYDMTTAYASVARSDGNNYVDALAGAALTGSLNSILVLVNSTQKIGTGTKAFDTVSRRIKGNLRHGYVYGGELAISKQYMDYIRKIQ